MSKPNRRYVLKPDPRGWKVYDRKLRKYWGNAFAVQDQAERAAEELNGKHRPKVIIEISKAMVR